MRYCPLIVTLVALAGIVLATPAPSVYAQTAGPCGQGGTVNHRIHVSGHEHTIRLETRGCVIEMRLRGEATYSPDFRGITSLSPGGSFRLEEDMGRSRRTLDLADDGRGGVVVDYRVGREPQHFDAEAEAWLADRLLILYRRSGLAAEARAEWLYRTGGVAGLLGEVEQVQSSSARAALLTHAMTRAELGDAELAHLLRSALPSSSSARGRILQSVTERGPLRGDVAVAYLDAVARTSSSTSQRQALEHALRDGDAPTPFVVAALHTAGRISSTSARTGVLGLVAAEYTFDDPLLFAYLDTAAGISSSSGQRDVLIAVLSRQELSAAQLARTLRAVGRISSSSAQADVLVHVARNVRLDEATRSVFVDVASSIPSSSHRARVFEALERGRAAGR
jgi:hypothetical protein